MKKKLSEKLKIRLLCLLAAVLLLGAGCSGLMRGIYADSDDGDDWVDPNASYWQSQSAAGEGSRKSDGGSVLNMTAGQRYVLEVYTGALPGNCSKYIIVRYYASAADKAAGIVSTQYLAPTDPRCTFWDAAATSPSFNASVLNDSIWEDFNGKGVEALASQRVFFQMFSWELSGSIYDNYKYFTTEAFDTDGGKNHYDYSGGSWYYNGADKGYYHDFSNYHEHANNLLSQFGPGTRILATPDYIEEFPTPARKTTNPEPFASGSTEYIIFRSEYGIYELESLDFYCETASANEAWLIEGWALYETNWNENFRYGVNNYAFVSDRMAFDIDYDRCLGKSTSDNMQEGFNVLDSDYYRFVKDTSANRNAKDSIGGQLYSHFFTVPSGSVNQSPAAYTFEINLMDSYGAGIEGFNRTPAPGDKLKVSEALTAAIEYKDAAGHAQELSVPVITNAIFEYTFPLEESAALSEKNVKYKNIQNGTNLLSYAQQGDSIVFSVIMPSKSEITKVTLHYENPMDYEDSILVEDIRVYETPDTRFVDREKLSNEADLEMTVTPRGNLVYESDQISGGAILENVNSEFEFEMKPAGTGAKNYTDYNDTYLISFKTSSVNFTDTQADDITVRFAYLDEITGKEMLSADYNLKEVCMDFCGYNPAYDAVSGTITDGSYVYNMGLGRTLRFLVELKNVSRFTKMIFMKGDIVDEWQIDTIEIRSVSKVGERIMTPLDNVTAGDLILNRIYDRDVSGSVIYHKENVNLLIQPNATVEFALENANVDIDIENRDYREYYYKMDYETAISNLHFNEAAWNYEVRVHVSPNSILTSANKGDSNGCGSNNLYYFQLVFTDGTSGYVLSNALLKSDCFRAGETETFTISVNESMGDVVAVKIIPDDVSEACDPLDKLSIDYIEVIKDNPKTPNKRYVCNDVGWVKLEYQDTEESVDNPGRSESEIVTICPVSSSAYMLDLEFNIAIGDYMDNNGIERDQFYGNMTADITYVTSSGERKVIRDYPVVEKMYEYAGKTPKTAVYADGTGTERYISDRDFMFRSGKIARFVVSVDDATSIESISLNGMGYENTCLPIAGISVKILKSSGRLIINKDGDYEVVYDVEPALLTDEVPGRTFPQLYSFPANKYTSYKFTFGINDIGELDESTRLEEIISRVPQSANDKLNVYLYMGSGTPTPAEGDYNLTVKTYYASVATSDLYLSACDSLKAKRDNGQLVLYAMDLSAANMTVLSNVQVVSNSIGRQDIKVEYGIIQQVRNGVVIHTYKIKFGGNMPAYTAKGISMQNSTSSLGFEQVVSVALGEDTVPAKLVEEKYDIALAIRYTSSNASDNTVFVSPYVFATDSGDGTIAPGKMLEFRFHEGYVRDIVGIDVVALNGINASLANANVLCYKADSAGSNELVGWYSIDRSGKIYSDVTKFTVTDNSMNGPKTLKRVNFSFKTMEYSDNIDSGGTVPIKMIINYKDVNKNIKTAAISDIRKYAAGSQSFTAGQTAAISFFLKGVDSINYIKLIPYDNVSANRATWNLESIRFNIDGSGDNSTHTIIANRTLVETTDDGTTPDDANDIFNLSGVKMTLTATAGGRAYAGDELDSPVSMKVGEEINVLPVINGSVTGAYYVRVEKRIGSSYAQTGSTQELAGTGFRFTPAESGYYRLIFTVVENPAVEKTVNLTVNP